MTKCSVYLMVLLFLLGCDSKGGESKRSQVESEKLKNEILEKQAAALEKQKQALADHANQMVQQISSQWDRVQGLYQKRMAAVSLLTRLLDFHQDKLTAKGAEAFAAVGDSSNLLEQADEAGTIDPAADDQRFAEYEKMQDALVMELEKLINEIENIADLKVMPEYLNFRTEMESTGNLIASERIGLNEKLEELKDLQAEK